jgi:hypothetical protein
MKTRQTLIQERASLQKSMDSPNLNNKRKRQLGTAIAQINNDLKALDKPKAKKQEVKTGTRNKEQETQKATSNKKQETGKIVFGNEVENRALFDFYAFTGGNRITFDALADWVSRFQENVKKGKIRKDSPVYSLLSTAFNIAKPVYNRAIRKGTNTLTLKVGADLTAKLEKIFLKTITDHLAGLGEIEEDEEDLDGLGCDTGCGCKKKNSLGSVFASDITADSISESMPLAPKWKPIFGEPSNGFKALVYGTAGSGKTTMLMDFCKDFVNSDPNRCVLYITGEQGVEKNGKVILANSFKRRLIDRNANVPRIEFLVKMPPLLALKDYDLLVIDSIQSLDLAPEDLENIADKYPNLSMILVSQITKNGNYRGTTAWAHNPDMVITLPEYGKVETEKNRFGALGSLNFK